VFKKFLGHKVSYAKALMLYLASFSFLRSRGHFHYQGQNLSYFYHRYNLTWLNERKIELPIVWLEMQTMKGTILEVGNVLSHYRLVSHLVIDKYEKKSSSMILNQDVLEHFKLETYNHIVSISTVEHIGQDEGEDPTKAIAAIKHMEGLLMKDGSLFITFPLGYNVALDEWIFSSHHIFGQIVFMKRHNILNEWSEVSTEKAKGSQFNSPYPLGNVIACCKLEKG
jgi:hypothetical protein